MSACGQGSLCVCRWGLNPDLDDSFAAWIPVPEEDLDDVYAVADTVTSYEWCQRSRNGNAHDIRVRMSRCRCGVLWHRDSLEDPTCACCEAKNTPAGPSRGDAENAAVAVRLFRCEDCGVFLQCLNWVISRHRTAPLHMLRKWDGEMWTEVTLAGLGLVYQLGHGGFRCPFLEDVTRSMVVMSMNGVHSVQFWYCDCDWSRRKNNLQQLGDNTWHPATTIDPVTCATFKALESFRLMNVVGNTNVHDYVGMLERLTDPTMMSSVLDRYKVFGRMSRQWAFLKRAKRSARAFYSDGLVNTKAGELAVLWWPCPHNKKNLPEGWEDVAPEWRFLYILLLALDANFRLKNRIQVNEHQDHSLGSGWGYFVERKAYRRHLKNYVAENDVSTCIAFAALLQKETRIMTGLRVLGVGGCVCAHHGVVQPQGMGDLQKGERYANMDWIFLCAIVQVSVLMLVISYDIACQWKVHLWEWAAKIAATSGETVDLAQFVIEFRLPVWHAAVHEESYVGIAKSVGVGDGARHDSLEDKIDYLNWEKNIHQGDSLARKLIVSIAERDRQIDAFEHVDKSLSSKLRKEWQGKIDAWLADKTQPNPYCLKDGRKGGPTEVQVRLDLRNDEAAENTGVAARGNAEGDSTQERRIAFMPKLRTFRNLQLVHMSGVAALIAEEEEQRDVEVSPPKVEHIKLLPDKEVCLRSAQCKDALDMVRSRLHAKRHLTIWRNANSAGQRAATQSSTLIGQALKGKGFALQFQELQAVDLTVDEQEESDALVQKKLNRIGSSKRRARNEPALKEKKTFSWIWTAGGGPGDDEEGLHDVVRVEWTKAKTRRDWWVEEVHTVREEMRRCLQMLACIKGEWEGHIGLRSDVDPELAAGLRAYATCQKRLHRSIAASFLKQWDGSAGVARRRGGEGLYRDGPIIEDGVEGGEGGGGRDGDEGLNGLD
ncbi:hypothetical protein C8J57DRAFT_1529783 [Mycena rebaudengoi]|nr:hypothetical protein C8J57DRAFT_1529783 [Mycena rebaudengoi]